MKKAFLFIGLALIRLAVVAQPKLGPAHSTASWFPSYKFSPSAFAKPPLASGPFTRWWWPGNDVTNEELQREVVLFAQNGFAGVEVQPFFEGLNPNSPADQLQRQLSWDTPAFYEHLRAMLEQARKSHLVVDLTAGSGWPMGGPTISPDSSMLTLTYADTLVTGGQTLVIDVPKLNQTKFTVNPTGAFVFNQTVPVKYATLQAVIAVRLVKKEKGQTFLDPGSVQDLTRSVKGNRLNWQAPQGDWRLMAFWSMPDGELPKSIAARPKGYVVDHLDSTKLKMAYEHLLGTRTGLRPYFGNPLRAVFNDSYEFMADRHYATHFLAYFSQQRGYDIAPYLPVVLKKYYNNAYIAPFMTKQPFEFVLSEEDWRLRYDYDRTVSDLLRSQLITSSNRWLNQRGLRHRTQAYGARMDVIGGSSAADIPETEQLAGGNSEAMLKLVSAGAHLNNRPLVSEEAFVFKGQAEMMTPQKIKLLADKSFAAGVNQLVYHGIPYKYQTGEYGKEGWSPFSSPFSTTQNFSSTLNESSPFWNDIKAINQYITRSQYVLQSGKPRADVLIYFPFHDFYPEQIFPNPTEILLEGQLAGVDPALSRPAAAEKPEGTQQWFAAVWPLINRLEAQGITWTFVNDAALQEAISQQGQLTIKGNTFQTLVLANLPYIPLTTAEKIAQLAKNGSRILVFGEAPVKQPSYLNYNENDQKTRQFIQQALTGTATRQIREEADLAGWVTGLPVQLTFIDSCPFTRTSERVMSDGSRIKFIWNQSPHWQRIALRATPAYKQGYWLDAELAKIVKNRGAALTYVLPPYGAVFLLATNQPVAPNLLSAPSMASASGHKLVTLTNWTVQSGDATVTNSPLFDWRTKDTFNYQSIPGVYTTTFTLTQERGKQYWLDLGTVYFTAEVAINGKSAGKRRWAPYQLDITPFLKPGENSIRVLVTPTYHNAFIGEALKGNPHYAQFKGKEKTLLPAGLVGPVTIQAMP